MRQGSSLRLITIVLAAMGTGCGRDLVFTTYTTLGVEIKGVNNVPTSLRLAYKRFEGAIIPVDLKATDHDDNQAHAPAHSIFAGMDVQQGGFGVKVAQVFASGKAATNAAKKGGIGFARTLRTLKDRVGIATDDGNGGS